LTKGPQSRLPDGRIESRFSSPDTNEFVAAEHNFTRRRKKPKFPNDSTRERRNDDGAEVGSEEVVILE
jgi:hypothetical protein